MASRTRPERRRPLLAGLTGLNALGALAGAVGLATGGLSLGSSVAQRLPFASPAVGGVALALIVAVPSTVVSIEALRGSRHTDAALVTAGVMLVGWILAEVAFIRELSFFHPLYRAVGLLMIGVGRRGGHHAIGRH